MADGSARRITEVTEGDSAIINMPSAGSHKSRVIEFSTSITGRRSTRPQEIGRNGTYLERELDDSIPLSKGAVLPFLSPSAPLLSAAIDRTAIDSTTFSSRRLFLIRLPDRVAVQRDGHRLPLFLDSRRATSSFDANI